MQVLPWQVERLKELVALWNKELGESLPMRAELFKQNSFVDDNICLEGSQIVVNDEGKVIGFIVVKYFKEKTDVPMRNDVGWIQALIVDSAYRNQGIGSRLLKHAEAVLKDKGMRYITLGRDTFHYLPGVPAEGKETATWFEKKDYVHYETDVDLSRTFLETERFDFPSLPNVEFSVLQAGEQEELLDFLHRCFPGRWELEAIQYFRQGGTGREFVVIKEKGKIVGFCRVNDSKSPLVMGNTNWAPLFDEELGGIGPLGVDQAKRKKGYGLAVVQAGIATLRERGIRHMVIDWTGLIEFYGKLGFNVWKTYKAYRKEIG